MYYRGFHRNLTDSQVGLHLKIDRYMNDWSSYMGILRLINLVKSSFLVFKTTLIYNNGIPNILAVPSFINRKLCIYLNNFISIENKVVL